MNCILSNVIHYHYHYETEPSHQLYLDWSYKPCRQKNDDYRNVCNAAFYKDNKHCSNMGHKNNTGLCLAFLSKDVNDCSNTVNIGKKICTAVANRDPALCEGLKSYNDHYNFCLAAT